MSNTTTHKERIRTTIRHHASAVACVVCGTILGGLLMYAWVSRTIVYAPVHEEQTVIVEETPKDMVATSTFARSLPTKLIIPKITLDATFVEPLGLNDDGTVSIPDSYEEVGWYVQGASPGEIGPAVILGHVDSYEGPAVFFSLGQLEEGDEVSVERADGTTATFVVTGKERLPQEQFPTESVYGPIDYAGLRLVTCTGIYDRSDKRYSHNLIVYARLKQ